MRTVEGPGPGGGVEVAGVAGVAGGATGGSGHGGRGRGLKVAARKRLAAVSLNIIQYRFCNSLEISVIL